MYADVSGELQTDGVEAESFEALADIAVANLQEHRNLIMVCGPITTGGTGNQTYNFQVFNATLKGLESRGKRLFNQVPYEFGLRRLMLKWEAAGNKGYCMPILEVFYARVFESGAISEGWFIPGWRSSFGARWEREKLTSVGCTVHNLTHADIREFLALGHPPEHVAVVMNLLSSE